MLIWIFGDVKVNEVYQHTAETASGTLELEKANVNWFLSIDANTFPAEIKQAGKEPSDHLLLMMKHLNSVKDLLNCIPVPMRKF